MGVRKVDYTDALGIPRRVLLPDEASGIDPSEGIPLSLDLDDLYAHMPPDFLRRLYTELWARGLVEPQDYLRPGAADLFMAALRAVVKYDALNAIALAKEVSKR